MFCYEQPCVSHMPRTSVLYDFYAKIHENKIVTSMASKSLFKKKDIKMSELILI